MTIDFELLGFSPADADDFRQLFKWWQERRQNTQRAPAVPVLQNATAVYLARTSAGIPAMTVEAGTGTDSSVGVVSKADCKLYRIDDWGSGVDVDPMGVEHTVYNPSIVAVPANRLFLAVQTSDGLFVAVQLSGGEGGTGSTVEPGEQFSTGATPPKPKLREWRILDYDLSTDTMVPRSVPTVWVRDINL